MTLVVFFLVMFVCSIDQITCNLFKKQNKKQKKLQLLSVKTKMENSCVLLVHDVCFVFYVLWFFRDNII